MPAPQAGNKLEGSIEFSESWGNYRMRSAAIHEQLLYPRIMRQLGDIQGKVVVDAGCGSGELIPFLARENPKQIIAIDINPHLVAAAKARCPALVTPIVHNLEHGLPALPECHAIVCSNVIVHLDRISPLGEGVARALSPQGKFVIATPHRDWIEHNHLYRSVVHQAIYQQKFGDLRLPQQYRTKAALSEHFHRTLDIVAREHIALDNFDLCQSLEPRYSGQFGAPIFDIFVYTRRVSDLHPLKLPAAQVGAPHYHHLELAAIWPPVSESTYYIYDGMKVSHSSKESLGRAIDLQKGREVLSGNFTMVSYAGMTQVTFTAGSSKFQDAICFPLGTRPEWAGACKWKVDSGQIYLERIENIGLVPDKGLHAVKELIVDVVLRGKREWLRDG